MISNLRTHEAINSLLYVLAHLNIARGSYHAYFMHPKTKLTGIKPRPYTQYMSHLTHRQIVLLAEHYSSTYYRSS